MTLKRSYFICLHATEIQMMGQQLYILQLAKYLKDQFLKKKIQAFFFVLTKRLLFCLLFRQMFLQLLIIIYFHSYKVNSVKLSQMVTILILTNICSSLILKDDNYNCNYIQTKILQFFHYYLNFLNFCQYSDNKPTRKISSAKLQ